MAEFRSYDDDFNAETLRIQALQGNTIERHIRQKAIGNALGFGRFGYDSWFSAGDAIQSLEKANKIEGPYPPELICKIQHFRASVHALKESHPALFEDIRTWYNDVFLPLVKDEKMSQPKTGCLLPLLAIITAVILGGSALAFC